jgi:WD40 repeat protein
VACRGGARDGKSLICRRKAKGESGLCLIDATTGKERLALFGGPSGFVPVASSPDGRWLAFSAHPSLRVVDTTTGKEVLTIPKAYARSLQWSPDSRRLAWDGDMAVTVWDAVEKKVRWSQRTAGTPFAKWSPDGRWLLFGAAGIAGVWDGGSGKEVLSTPKPGGSRFTWGPDGQRLLIHEDGKVRLLALPSKKQLVLGEPPEGLDLHAVDWHPRDQAIATGSRNGLVKVWDAATGKLTLTLPDLAEGAREQINVDLANHPGLARRAFGEGARTASVTWGPDGKSLAAAARVGTVTVWDVPTWKLRARWRAAGTATTLDWPRSDLFSLTWSPDGQYVATGSQGVVGIWEAATGKQLRLIRCQALSIAWSKDGKRLAAAGNDHTAKILDTGTGEIALTLRGPAKRTITSVAWGPDGQRLPTLISDPQDKAFRRDDEVIYVWDAITGKELLVLRGLPGFPNQSRGTSPVKLAWSRDGQWLAAQALRGEMPITPWAAPGLAKGRPIPGGSPR